MFVSRFLRRKAPAKMEIGMKILLINGSPKGDRSNTLKLSKAFLEGILEIDKDAEIRQLNLSEKKDRSL